jgi:CHRD domain-containing protein
MKRGFTVAVIGVAMLSLGLSVGAQGSNVYKARLSPVPIDATMAATVAGSGSVTATLAGTKLSIAGTFEGLRSPATTANVHFGRKGVRGASLFDLTITKATSGTITGDRTLTSVQMDNLKDGKLYVQVQSEKAPDGNLWGWLLK